MMRNKTQILVFVFFSFFITLLAQTKSEDISLQREKIVELAKSLEGKPYKYGAVGPKSFDCSGFVYYVFRTAIKKQLPRTSPAILDYSTQINKADLQPGDLVFFKTTSSGQVSHVGIYIGSSKFISALSDGSQTGVVVRSLNDSYWKPKYCGAGRIVDAEPTEEKKTVNKKQTQRKQEIDDDDFVGLKISGDCSSCSLLSF